MAKAIVSAMKVHSLPIDGLLLIEPEVYRDNRGYFYESFNAKRFNALTGLQVDFVQDNESASAEGVLRGLHFQLPPFEQGKLVRVVKGSVLDVAVDLRLGSPTFGQHASAVLSAENKLQFWIPPGFAHGFLALDEGATLAYKCTGYYHQPAERVLRFDDEDLGIVWGADAPTLSEKDAEGLCLADCGSFFKYATHA
jgi:dTDP-4-dehydrorhamnose 3,5-epimerase